MLIILSRSKTKMAQVTFGNTPITNGQMVGKDIVKEPVTLVWNSSPELKYAILMYDVSTTVPYIHYLAVNIPGMEQIRGKTVIPYPPPHPPKGTTHQYYVDLFVQSKPITIHEANRVKFDIPAFVQREQLRPLARSMFLVDPPSEQQAKFCRCVIDVQKKGSAYNPYAVCAKSVGTTYRHCSDEVYDFKTMPVQDLQAYAALHKLPMSENREQLLQSIVQMKAAEGKTIAL
jgi:hypothetical protein